MSPAASAGSIRSRSAARAVPGSSPVSGQTGVHEPWPMSPSASARVTKIIGALSKLRLAEPGYGMPLEVWVQAACLGLRIREIPIPRVYLDPERSFGAALDDAGARLAYYQQVIDRAFAWAREHNGCSKYERSPVFAF